MKKIISVVLAGVVVLGLVGCAKKTEVKGKGSSSKETVEAVDMESLYGSSNASVISEVWDRINGESDEPTAETEEKAGPAFTLDQTGYMSPYKFMYPSTAKKPDMNKSTILVQDEHFVLYPMTFYDKDKEGQDFANMSMEDYVSFCAPILTGTNGFSQAYGGIFSAHTDCAIYMKIETRQSFEMNGRKACIIHGKFGDPLYFDETYFVACFVLDAKDPFVLWASPWVVNASEHEWKSDEEAASPERMELFLRQVLETVEVNDWS